MPPEIVDLDHIAFRVSDLDAALEFYHEKLGLPIRDREKFDNGNLPFVSLVAGGRHLHLFPADDPIEIQRDHICLLVRSNDTDTKAAMESLLSELREAGIEVQSDEPRERLGAYGRDWAAYITDPDGRTVELKLH
ncbi:MAG: VOC family protein [Halobacteriales archaeon]